ncbi:hypothetical protein SH449x_005454 [Pirellulaceae bacterium SH449]
MRKVSRTVRGGFCFATFLWIAALTFIWIYPYIRNQNAIIKSRNGGVKLSVEDNKKTRQTWLKSTIPPWIADLIGPESDRRVYGITGKAQDLERSPLYALRLASRTQVNVILDVEPSSVAPRFSDRLVKWVNSLPDDSDISVIGYQLALGEFLLVSRFSRIDILGLNLNNAKFDEVPSFGIVRRLDLSGVELSITHAKALSVLPYVESLNLSFDRMDNVDAIRILLESIDSKCLTIRSEVEDIDRKVLDRILDEAGRGWLSIGEFIIDLEDVPTWRKKYGN